MADKRMDSPFISQQLTELTDEAQSFLQHAAPLSDPLFPAKYHFSLKKVFIHAWVMVNSVFKNSH
jgi:hypothetical protein